MKGRLLLVFFACAASYIGGWLVGTDTKSMVVNVHSADEVVKTVAHLRIDNPDYELLWSDIDSDTAYYRYVGDRELAKAGDTVYTYTNDKCKILSVTLLGFTIKAEEILPVGTSGTNIKNADGEVIGYVSQSIGDNQYYCIWN